MDSRHTGGYLDAAAQDARASGAFSLAVGGLAQASRFRRPTSAIIDSTMVIPQKQFIEQIQQPQQPAQGEQ